MLGIKYVRVGKSIILFNQHLEYICDCVAFNERFYWDKSSIIINETGKVKIIKEFTEQPNDWNNTHTKSIINALIVYKNPDTKTRIKW